MNARNWIKYCAVLLIALGSTTRTLHAATPDPTNSPPLSSWSFEDVTNWYSDPGYLPISFTNISSFQTNGINCLIIDSTNNAYLSYNVVENYGTTNAFTNITVDAGSILFWVSPSWIGTNQGGAGPGQWGRLIEIGASTTNSSYGWWSLCHDPSGNVFFYAQSNSPQVTYLSTPVAWNTNNSSWIHIALTYSSTNSSLYINGSPVVTNGSGVTVYPDTNVLSKGFFIGSDTNGTTQSHAAFASLYTYNYPLSASDVAAFYTLYSVLTAPVPITDITNAPSTNVISPIFKAVTGAGYLTYLSNSVSCVTNSSVWLTNLSAKLQTNNSVTVTFAIVGGSNAVSYDVFGTSALQIPFTNAIWAWLGQGENCKVYSITNLPTTGAYLVLGTDQDSDQDGLTDAYENLVSHTDPQNPDTLGIGLSDGFQIAYFGYMGVDPYGDPDNDGWLTIEEFQNGTPATVFNTPTPPRNFTATLNPSNWVATLSWQPPSGVVTGYTIARWDDQLVDYTYYSTGPTNRFIDTAFTPYTNFLYNPDSYAIQALYPGGASSWAYASPYAYANTPLVLALPGPAGSTVLALLRTPSDASSLLLTKLDWDYSISSNPTTTNTSLALTLFTNGFYTLPPEFSTFAHDYSSYYVQAVWPDGTASSAVPAGYPAGTAFYDGRAQLSQNLAFVLRAAGLTRPMYFEWSGNLVAYPTNYAFAGYNASGWTGSSLDIGIGWSVFTPFDDNYLYRNMVYSTNDVRSDGLLTNGFSWYYDPLTGEHQFSLGDPHTYTFHPPTNTTTVSSLLSSNQTQWIMPYIHPEQLGVSTNSLTTFSLASGVLNSYGLALRSVLMCHGTWDFRQLSAGGASIPRSSNDIYQCYPEFDQPSLQTAGYHFYQFLNGTPASPSDTLPGSTDFSTTNAQPLLIASLGNLYQFVGYAKQTITNGDTSKPAYLGQYFDKARKLDTSGGMTTNTTGILTEYGWFFPAEPGGVALTTMTNWNDGASGTAVVHVVSISTDLNHDGVIDNLVTGPDSTAAGARPFRFWVNDNSDSDDDGGDGIPGKGPQADTIPGRFNDNIQGTRDLTDFFPVSINIQSLLQALPSVTNLQFILKQDDSALYALPTDLRCTNSINYLRDTNFLQSVASNAPCTIVSSSGYVLSSNFLAKIRDEGKGILLIEASLPTTSPLNLEIWQGTNLLAQASLPLSIDRVEKMFRHKNLITETFPSATSAGDLPERLADGDVPNEPETNDKNFVFVHGYNVNPNQARGNASDIFKRLYWSGSHAKFYGITWRGNESQVASAFTPNLQTNIVNAFLTAPKLKDFLATLTNGPTVAAGHSLGNMVLMSALSDWNANIQTYFMIDAAVAIEALEGDVPVNTNMIHPDWSSYTNRLWASKWFTLFPTNDFRSTLTWSNRLANVQFTNIYNFYSSGEEALREQAGEPPDVVGAIFTQVVWDALFGADPVGTYTWAWQEKLKGRCQGNGVIGSNHGGWKFESYYDIDSTPTHMSPSNASQLTNSALQSIPFFSFAGFSGAPPFLADLTLTETNGSSYAQTNRNRIIADAIPALTLPIGANPVPVLTPLVGPDRNLDMQASFENGWPPARPLRSFGALAPGEWHHSDFRQVAYTFTYPLFNQFVILGNLK